MLSNLSSEGVGKVKGLLKTASIIETVVWAVIGIVVIIMASAFSDFAINGIHPWIVIGVVVVLGICSGVSLYFGVEKESNILLKVHGIAGIKIVVGLVVVMILVVVLSLDNAEHWIILITSLVLLPIKIYELIMFWKYYKWSNRAAGVGRMAAAVGLA